MHSLRRLALLALGSIAFSGPAAALTIVKLDPSLLSEAPEELQSCARFGCLQPVQMPMWPFGERQRTDAMPADQRDLLARLLSPELSEVVTPAERQILSQALDRGDRLSAEAVGELTAMLRDKQSQQTQRLATAKAEAERRRQQEQAEAEAERQRQAAEAEAEAGRQRQQREAQADADAERRRQSDQAATEAARQRQAAEAQRQLAAAAEAERRRQAELAEAEVERQRQAAAVAQALAEAKRAAEEAAAANAARLVFHDEFPPLQPL